MAQAPIRGGGNSSSGQSSVSLDKTNSDLLGVVILEVVVAGIGLGATLVISFSEHENSKRKPGSEPGLC